MRDEFLFFKKNALLKKDKSHEGRLDQRIEKLCNEINRSENFFTTSSCAGRIIIVRAIEKKSRNIFLFKSHEKITSKQIMGVPLESVAYFHQEPCAIHVACRNFEYAQKLLNIARNAGWKKAGIITSKHYPLCEMFSTETIVVPINPKLQKNMDFLELLVNEANRKLERTHKKIDRLLEAFKEKFRPESRLQQE